MKHLLLLALLTAALPQASSAQGTVFFYNYAPAVGLNAPVFNTDGKTALTGVNFQAQLYAGPAADALAPVGQPAFFAGPQPGYWMGFGSSLDRLIPDVAPGAAAFVEVKVWSNRLGATYDQVVAAGGKHGASSVFSVITGGDTQGGTQPPTFPAFLTGMQSFSLTGLEPDVPEPRTALLLLAGGGVLLLRRVLRRS